MHPIEASHAPCNLRRFPPEGIKVHTSQTAMNPTLRHALHATLLFWAGAIVGVLASHYLPNLYR